MTSVLDDRALNRALLERQLLLRRVRRSALDTVEHLVGLQAQEPEDPYVGLWTRLDGFDPVGLGAALEDRAVVRVALQRSTIHLVTARDCLALRPVLQRVGERMARGQFGRRLAGGPGARARDAARPGARADRGGGGGGGRGGHRTPRLPRAGGRRPRRPHRPGVAPCPGRDGPPG